MRLFRNSWKISMYAGALLSQIGEFSFMYFCVSAGNLSDLTQLASSSTDVLWYTLAVMVCSVTLHLLACWFLKIDRATFVVTFVGGIFSPAMIGPIVSVMGQRQALIGGIVAGLTGLALGNLLGLLTHFILKMLI